jgi:FdhD protein
LWRTTAQRNPSPANPKPGGIVLKKTETGGKAEGKARGKARHGSKTRARVRVFEDGRTRLRSDVLATEEPMEIRLVSGGTQQTVAVTMRTPGSDFELAAGFLYGEGIVSSPEDIRRISYCVDRELDAEQRYNIVNVEVRDEVGYDPRPLERHFYTTSACGVCGKASLEQLELRGCPVIAPGPVVPTEVVYALPETLREAQGLFDATGGLHAAALFDAEGNLLALREDIGRHNATDKLVGWALLEGRLPLSENLVMLSGRSSFEILQKCLRAGVPVVCAISAPSSLAVDVARRFGMTLVGFLRGNRFNVYSGSERVYT